jgi:hypothetical protein
MDLVGLATAQQTAIVLRGVDIRVLDKLLSQQQQDGRAAVELIRGAAATSPLGAPEPGKGLCVDCVA